MKNITYRFSIGDSTNGQVGMCFDFTMRQTERNPQEAVDAVKAALAEFGTDTCMTGLSILPAPFSHICVYPNEDLITVDDIVDIHESGIESTDTETVAA